MRILEISQHSFERHKDNPRRFYAQRLDHGSDHSNRFKHIKILWLGLWFFELRMSLNSKPN